jgi:hypothetical protein
LAPRRLPHYTETVTRTFSALNVRQLEVLRWISDACPEGVMEGHSYKTTAVALANRRLVTLSNKGGTWRAVITSVGKHYLEHGGYVTSTPTTRKPLPVTVTPPQHLPPGRMEAQGRSRTKPKAAQPKAPPPTEQLITELVANGEVRVSGPQRAKYEARVAAAIRFAKVPEGKQLLTKGSRWSAEYVVQLRDAPAWMNTVLDPIPVPTTLRHPDPVVVALQAGKHLPGIDRSSTHRALLLVQALAVEARQRGYTVKETKVTGDHYGYDHWESEDFLTVIDRHSVGIRLRQVMNRAPHEPSPAEQTKAASDRWYSIPKYDVTPSDRLSIHLSGGIEHRQSKWTDGRAGSLEEGLPQILQEIELRAEAAEQARLAAIAAAEEERR